MIKTLHQYRKSLSDDVAFGFTARTLLFVCLASLLLFALLGLGGSWAVTYANSDAPQNWKEYVCAILGITNGKPEAGSGSVLYSVLVRLLATIVIGGVVTSFLCALANRVSEMKLRGLLVPSLRDHYVVFGYCDITKDILHALLVPDIQNAGDFAQWTPQASPELAPTTFRKRKILLVTGGDVQEIRQALNSALSPELAKRIIVAYDRSRRETAIPTTEFLDSLSLRRAQQVYIVGDASESDAGDVSNLAIATCVGNHVSKTPNRFSKDRIVPIFVRLDQTPSFDFVKKISFLLPGQSEPVPKTFFKPFGFSEGWARRVFGGLETDFYSPLDFSTLHENSVVHLVVLGLSDMGEALVLEAIRVCHFPSGRNTRITIADGNPSVRDSFLARHPGIDKQLPDIEIEFIVAEPESPQVRNHLVQAALDPDQLLTVAVCLSPSDRALETALSLPEEVYWHRLPAKKKTIRDHYRENGPRILVLQEHRNGIGEAALDQKRFENLRVFGMQENGLNLDCIREFPAMYLNAVYDWPRESDGSLWIDRATIPSGELNDRIASFRDKWKEQLAPDNPYGVFEIDAGEKHDLLQAILSKGGEPEIQRFKDYAFRKYLALKPELRWANVYVSDSWGVAFRALGLRSIRDLETSCAERIQINDEVFSAARKQDGANWSLAKMEHNRWVADRVLMGYRAPRPDSGEIRDDAFRYHFDIRPFEQLTKDEIGKDELSIACIPLFAALEGFQLKRQSENGN